MTLPPIAETSQSGTPLTGEHHVLELIATGAGLHDVLDALCRVIDEQSGLMSSVFLLDRTGRQMKLAAGPHLPDAWRQTITSLAVTPTNTSCGAAVSSRGQVIVTDVATSPLFTPWRDAARMSRIASVWSTPFFSKNEDVLGTFAVLSHEPRRPDQAQLHLVDRATHLASIAVERHQTEEGLRESERRFSTTFYSSPASMTIHRFGDGRFLYVNDTFVTLFGYSRAEALGQTALGLSLWADPSRRSELLRLLNEHGTARDFDAKARTKSGDILDLLVWMARIQILGEECVLGIACDITARKRAEEALGQSERLLRLVLDALPVGVAVMDRAGDIILSNPASQRIWSGLISSGPERYFKSKGWWHDTGKALEPGEWASVRAVVNGETSVNEVLDIEAFDGVRKIIQNSAVPIRDANEDITGAVVVNEDISARKAAERERNDSFKQMRTLTGRLMRAQDDERRRIAQMLHETTAQDLAALKMHLARLTRTDVGLSDADRAALTESIDLAERSMTGIRTLSYLLHPPFLDEAGLLSALRWYASGFAERSGIKVDLDLPSTLERMPQEVETTLFRVVQEALINIHHHAESPTASIRLRVEGHRLTLEIEDRGRGMPSEVIAQLPTGGGALGVGVAGMRERLQQLGGTLYIEASARGTTVRAQISLPPNAA
jgi:PAS domain S-box-containing protein